MKMREAGVSSPAGDHLHTCSPGSICDTCSLVFLKYDMPDTAAVSHLFSSQSHTFI